MSKGPSRETLYALYKAEVRYNKTIRQMEAKSRSLERIETTYKFVEGNQFRDQLEKERGNYVTKEMLDTTIAKVEQAARDARAQAWTRTLAIAAVFATLIGALYFRIH